MPALVSVAGSDPGSGTRAGLQADAEMARGTGTHFLGVVAVETEQGDQGLTAVKVRPAEEVEEGLRAAMVDAEMRGPFAVKCGALGNAEIVQAVLHVRRDWPDVPWLIDPVRRASRSLPGVPPLLDDAGWALLCSDLAASVDLVLPNREEFEAADGFDAARAVLLTGGDAGGETVVDALRLDGEWMKWESPRIPGGELVHGTGCRLSATIACAMAAGLPLKTAIEAGRGAFQAWLRSVAGK